MLEINKIYNIDCLEGMELIEEKSVDMILCDLPYGVTQNKKDIQIDLNLLWKQYKRILKPTSPVILTSQFPFTMDLILSNKKWFKYDLIWNKVLTSGFLNANRMPLRQHEHILVFYDKLPVYNPQKVIGNKNHSKGIKKENKNRNYGKFKFKDSGLGNLKHPTSIINISKKHPSICKHRTEKPVELAEWLIKTFSNKGNTILDNCIGTGWTAVASIKNNRNYIGFELDKKYYDICNENLRIMEQ